MNTMTTAKDQAANPAPAGVARLHLGDDGIAVLALGSADEGIVTLTRERIESIERELLTIKKDSNVRGVVVTGPGPEMFAAGADIKLIERIESPTEGAEAARNGRRVFQGLQELSVPVVAAIEGPCLGGALELALFCDLRVASDSDKTQIGLPEVKLGIVPGFGGTQTLTRLVGLPMALELILKGKVMDARQAARKGVIDRVVPSARLMAAAAQEIEKLSAAGRKRPARRLRGSAFWLSKVPPLRALVARKVRKTLTRDQARFYPAPRRALELCVQAFSLPAEKGFSREAEALGEMIASSESKGLVHLYFLTERAKKLGKADGATDVKNALVVGGGVMGAGIAGLMARKGVRVRLCDLDTATLARGKARLQKDLDKRLRRRRMRKHETVAVQDRLAVSTEWGRLEHQDLWIEAVVEDLDVKRHLLQQAVDSGLSGDAVLATNTSSLSIDAMAETVPSPERVVGIHFFNPPEKMPLVEVIRGAATADAAVATACRLAIRLGKFPVVVKDAPGFLVNRCLAPYLNQAARLMLEGNEPEFVDRVMLDFGMPMGPARLLDEVGLDVACKVSEVIGAFLAERLEPSPLFAAMVGARALGRKSGGGIYGADGEGRGPGRAVLAGLRAESRTTPRSASRSEVTQRLVYPMVDEAYRCLDEGLVSSEKDLDLGLVMGIGFPPFTGGITRFAEREGLKTIVAALDDLARRLDPRFAPSDGLRRRALGD